MTHRIIRKLRIPHCQKGPSRCAICARTRARRPVCIDIDPPDKGEVARPVVEVVIDGDVETCEYDVIEHFADESEALEYASRFDIEDVDLK